MRYQSHNFQYALKLALAGVMLDYLELAPKYQPNSPPHPHHFPQAGALKHLVFAESAQDQKKGAEKTRSQHILGKMKLNGHVDPDLFDIFIWENVYEEYAQKFLEPHLIDAIDFSQVPGYSPPPAS
jgi:hypothetical protein